MVILVASHGFSSVHRHISPCVAFTTVAKPLNELGESEFIPGNEAPRRFNQSPR
jgi:hypothetical protein